MEPLPLPDFESDNTAEPLDPTDYPFVIRAVYEVAKILKDEEFASSVTAWGLDKNGWPHGHALALLNGINKNADAMIRERINELRAHAESHKTQVKKISKFVLSPLSRLFK